MRRKELLDLLCKCYQESFTRNTGSNKATWPESCPVRQSGNDAVQSRLFASGKRGSGPKGGARDGRHAPVFPQNMKTVKGEPI